MPKFFVKTSQIKEENIYINGTDFNHISNVLRLKVGEQITIGNMDTGENYLCEILKFDKEKVTTKIIEKLKEQKEIKSSIENFEKWNGIFEDSLLSLELDDEGLIKESLSRTKELEKELDKFDLEQMLSGEYDKNDAILTVNSGAGGTDAQDWAQMLL